MKKVNLLVFCFLVAMGTGLILAQPSNAGPLPSGTTVIVFIDSSGNQPEPDPGPPTDMLIFTGGRTFWIELPGCSDQMLSLQNAVLVDAGSGRSSRTISAVVHLPIPPGTRLVSFVANGGCTSDGISYRKYTAVVE